MVRLLDSEIRSERLVFRILIALLLASLSLAVLYLLPKTILGYISMVQENQLKNLLYQILDTNTLTLGIVVSFLVLITVTLRTTKAEGPLLILLGVSLIAYWFILLHGGTIILPIPEAAIQKMIAQYPPMSIQVNLTVNITTLFLSTICPAFLVIVKGVLLIVNRFRSGFEKRPET